MVLVAILCALQGGACFYCGVSMTGPTRMKKGARRETQWSRDHVLPLSKGGKLYVLACLKCNGTKGCRMPTVEELRRATLLRAQVDKIGMALQGTGWTTLEAEKANRKAQIERLMKRPNYQCPRWYEQPRMAELPAL